MSLTECLTPKIFKDALSQVLVNYLGTYTYGEAPNTYTRPSIAIGNPPNDIYVCGLEVIIPLFPRAYGYHVKDQDYREEWWDIILIQREFDAKGMVLPLAVERLERFFQCYQGQYIPQNSPLGTYESYRISAKMYSLRPLLTEQEINNP